MKNTFNPDEINLSNIRKIVFKIMLGFGLIAGLFFIAINITQNKLSQLSGTVVTIMKPNIKLIKLKKITAGLYGAEENLKAYTIKPETSYLLSYEHYINDINEQLDTLQLLSAANKIIDSAEAKNNEYFSLQIDTLRELIIARISLFNEYNALKSSEGTQGMFLELLQKIRAENESSTSITNNEAPKKDIFSKLFSSKKLQDEEVIQKIIVQTQVEEKIKEAGVSSKEINITQREYVLKNQILTVLKRIEENEYKEGVKRIQFASEEANSRISFISNWLTVLGLILAILFSFLIYRDMLRAKGFKERLLLIKINAEKLASQYARSLIEASLDPMFTVSPEGKITDMNEATLKITDSSREKIAGKDFSEYFTDTGKAQKAYQQIFTNGFITDYPLTIKSKKLIDVLLNGSVYKNDKGNVLGVVIVARDITEQKRFEDELIQAKSNAEQATLKAEESNKLKESFLANMSHEIRTPMNAIIGYSDILSNRGLEDQEKEYVKAIKLAGENLLTIINDILDISKIEAGMMTFEDNNFSVDTIFESLNGMLKGRAKEKGLKLEFSCDKNVPEVLLGDHTRLTQVMLNLMGNAIKFTQKGSVKVHAKLLEKIKENTLIEFSVSDTGIGIPQDKLEGIFERFQQAEPHTTRKYGGTGLGLAIAKQLIALQGGKLSVKSEYNVGSVFSFSIPYKKSTHAPEQHKLSDKKPNVQDLSQLKILLVEDNKLNVMLIKSLFAENNLQLQTAENGLVCIEKLKQNNDSFGENRCFDIILMDMEMPEMDGYEATTVIRKKLKNKIPIVAMTANAMAGEREKCLSLGMNDYISKPINANVLFEKINTLTINTKCYEQ